MVGLLFQFPVILCSLSLLLPLPHTTAALRHTTRTFLNSDLATHTSPTTAFEVTKPIPLPPTTPCSYLLLRHDFAFTYGQPPATAAYSPPLDCPSQTFSKIVLEWSATSTGIQFDRIAAVWLGGVELLRTSTAEPPGAAIFWTVKKDVTKYRSIFSTNQTLAVYLGNLVNAQYTGVYHVNVSLHFYPAEQKLGKKLGVPIGADLIIPISRTLPLNDALWFDITDSTPIASKQITIPLNSYRAILEVYLSNHETDEFHYLNLPKDYIVSNNLTGENPNGPFREVVVTLDDDFVIGAICPFTVIYTGGFNPRFWQPITGIGSFNLPSYNIEVTPFLGNLLDGKMHKIGFSVTNVSRIWHVDANLHVWLDEKSNKTQGKLLGHESPSLSLSVISNFSGLDGYFVTNSSRSIVSSGWVESSLGKITTRSIQGFTYTNVITKGNNGNYEDMSQVIHLNTSVVNYKEPSSMLSSLPIGSDISFKMFSIRLIDNDSTLIVSLAIDEEWKKGESGLGVLTGKLKNMQDANRYNIAKNETGARRPVSTRQEYRYTSDEGLCYYRNVKSTNSLIIDDKENNDC